MNENKQIKILNMLKKKKKSIISLLRKKTRFEEAVRKVSGHSQLANFFPRARKEHVKALIWYLHISICSVVTSTDTKQFL